MFPSQDPKALAKAADAAPSAAQKAKDTEAEEAKQDMSMLAYQSLSNTRANHIVSVHADCCHGNLVHSFMYNGRSYPSSLHRLFAHVSSRLGWHGYLVQGSMWLSTNSRMGNGAIPAQVRQRPSLASTIMANCDISLRSTLFL